MDNKVGIGLSSLAADPPFMGPGYAYSWAVDFSQIPELDSAGEAYLKFGGTSSTDFPRTSKIATTQMATPQPAEGIRIESSDDAGTSTKLGFPYVTGTSLLDTLKFFKPHATHSGIPIAAISAKYKYFSMVLTYHSETSDSLACANRARRCRLAIGESGGYSYLGISPETGSIRPRFKNGEAIVGTTPQDQGGMNSDGSDLDKVLWLTWDLTIATDWESDVINAVFDPAEITHEASLSSDVFSVTYYGFVISADVPSGADLNLPVHVTRPDI